MTRVLEKWLSEVYIGLKEFFCRCLNFVKGKYESETLLKRTHALLFFQINFRALVLENSSCVCF